MKKILLLLIYTVVFGFDFKSPDVSIVSPDEMSEDFILSKYKDDPRCFVYKNKKTGEYYLYSITSEGKNKGVEFFKTNDLEKIRKDIPSKVKGELIVFSLFSPEGYRKKIKNKERFFEEWKKYIDRFKIETGRVFGRIVTDRANYVFILESTLPKKEGCIKCNLVKKKDEERNVLRKNYYKILLKRSK